jgi:hypothetical protein
MSPLGTPWAGRVTAATGGVQQGDSGPADGSSLSFFRLQESTRGGRLSIGVICSRDFQEHVALEPSD